MRWRMLGVFVLVVAMGGIVPVAAGAPAPYSAPKCVLVVPAVGGSSSCNWTGVQLQSPGSTAGVALPDLTRSCHPASGDCEDAKVVVPRGVHPASLYVKVAWTNPVWSAYLYLIDPAGHLHGQGGLGCDTSVYDKGCGNQTTQSFDELVVADPTPGTWTVRVAAVNFHNEAYTGMVAFTGSSPLAYAKETLAQLMSHLTRSQPVNLVFAGWRPTAAELADLRHSLTSEFVPSVAQKQSCDGGDTNDNPASGLVQHATSHCTATTSTKDPNYNPAGAVPYFEPVRYLFDYKFLAADDTWTRDLFAAMKAATTRDHALAPGRIPETTETAPFKAAYLAAYNATGGLLRGPSSIVTDTSKVDEIDGLTVEDWIQAHRFDARYATSFTNLASGQRTSAAFINPDPSATHDPYWNGNGTRPINVDRDPQGVQPGLTFFLLDTFTPSYAGSYFRPGRYHSWWTASHVTDPDTGQASFADNGRGWGGRYRFNILDLGSAPSTYERANWVSASVAPDGGSAAFDPPIWEYRHSPLWQGRLPLAPLQAGGNTLGQVMGWEITQGLAFKYVGDYLYRPIPNDVYVLATTNIVDHYSLPSEGDLYAVDMTKVSKAGVALKALSSAAPYDTFLPGPDKTQVLGCASNRVAIIGNPTQVAQLTQGLVKPVRDPRCGTAGNRADPLQQAIEDAKATGGAELLQLSNGVTVPTYAVNQHKIRDYIDAHRSQYAPIVPGAFTVPVVNVMFEHDFNVALPLLVGGIAENVNGGEGWGQFDNVNDVLVPSSAIDCAKSAAYAPGCHGIPDIFRHDYGLTYTIEHESAHFLGLNHPHDGATTVGRAPDGSWHYYYSMLKWLYDSTASPTTYAGSYGTYEMVDQEKLMAGHAAEYIKQMQDWLADAYFMDGAKGLKGPSQATQTRVGMAMVDRGEATSLFRAGDLLHAMYAMRNAALHAKGVTTAPVQPHQMTLAQAATNTAAVFAINPQPVYSSAPTVAMPRVWFSGTKPRTAGVGAATAQRIAPLLSFCHINW